MLNMVPHLLHYFEIDSFKTIQKDVEKPRYEYIKNNHEEPDYGNTDSIFIRP